MNDRWTQSVAVGLAVVSLSLSGLLVGPIKQTRQQLRLTIASRPSGEVPPRVAIAMAALGPFRALAIDYLWYRANTFQQDGKYFEANQLAQWITALQPRAPHVWGFHAWNMAYNISVATYTRDERWDWVNKGINLLRDRGIPYNPGATRLYRELGWIFFHKIGQFADNMHWHYRSRMALEWHEVMGAPTAGATGEQAVEAMRRIVEAPDSLDELTSGRAGVGGLLEALSVGRYAVGEELLRQINRVEMFAGVEAETYAGQGQGEVAPRFDSRIAEVVRDPAWAEALGELRAFLQKKTLREAYHMDPGFMLELMELYGPMDWRHPVAHGCYWSERGVAMSAADGDKRLDLLNTQRQSSHSIQQLAWTGKISFDPLTGRIDMMPDPRFIPAYDRAMDRAKARVDAGDYWPPAWGTFEKAHENFLLRAISDLYLYGDLEQAQAFYQRVRKLYGLTEYNRRTGRYLVPLAELVASELRNSLDQLSNVRQFIAAMLGFAFDHGLGQNDLRVFERYIEIAQLAHRSYQKERSAGSSEAANRVGLLPFEQVLIESFVTFMQSSDVSISKRSGVWLHAPLEMRQRVYDRVRAVLERQAAGAGVRVEAAFPEPGGMESVRDAATGVGVAPPPSRPGEAQIERR